MSTRKISCKDDSCIRSCCVERRLSEECSKGIPTIVERMPIGIDLAKCYQFSQAPETRMVISDSISSVGSLEEWFDERQINLEE